MKDCFQVRGDSRSDIRFVTHVLVMGKVGQVGIMLCIILAKDKCAICFLVMVRVTDSLDGAFGIDEFTKMQLRTVDKVYIPAHIT